MEEVEAFKAKAKRSIHIADHMIYMTYNVVRDPKILLSIMDNIFLSQISAINAVLHQEKVYKSIPSIPEGFEAKFMLFKSLYSSSIGDIYLKMIRDVKDTIFEHKTSPVEFRRKDKYIICNGSYKMRTISIEKIKEYIKLTKEFLQLTEKIINLKNAP